MAAADLFTQVGFECQGHANYVAAEAMLRRALNLIEQHSGGSKKRVDYRVAIAQTNLAVLFQSMSPPSCLTAHPKLVEAEQLLRSSCTITEKAYGKNHVETAQRLNNLAMLLRAQGKLEEAEQPLMRAVAITQNVVDANAEAGKVDQDLETKLGIRLDNLARIYLDQMKLVHAEPLLKRALEILERTLPDSEEVMYCLNNLVKLSRAQENDDEAESHLRTLQIKQTTDTGLSAHQSTVTLG